MIDVSELLQKKISQKISLERDKDMIVVKKTKYDEETGERKEEKDYISLKELLIKRKQLEDEIDRIDRLLDGIVSKNVINLTLKQIYG
jgi:hypothetical protein